MGNLFDRISALRAALSASTVDTLNPELASNVDCPPDQQACGSVCCEPEFECCHTAAGTPFCCSNELGGGVCCVGICCPTEKQCCQTPAGTPFCCQQETGGVTCCGTFCCPIGACCQNSAGTGYCCPPGEICVDNQCLPWPGPLPTPPGLPFCDDFNKAKDKCKNSTPQERLRDLEGVLNKWLDGSGVPHVVVNAGSFGGHFVGEFHDSTWSVTLKQESVDSCNVDAQTLAHEARHAEQVWNVARFQAGRGVTGSQLSSSLGIPQSVAQLASDHRLSGNSPEAALAQVVYESIYGKDADYRTRVLDRLRDNPDSPELDKLYRDLPEEKDAYEAGRNNNCR